MNDLAIDGGALHQASTQLRNAVATFDGMSAPRASAHFGSAPLSEGVSRLAARLARTIGSSAVCTATSWRWAVQTASAFDELDDRLAAASVGIGRLPLPEHAGAAR